LQQERLQYSQQVILLMVAQQVLSLLALRLAEHWASSGLRLLGQVCYL